jgi:pimeloyl-ACP methyl ester carboxylesterase
MQNSRTLVALLLTVLSWSPVGAAAGPAAAPDWGDNPAAGHVAHVNGIDMYYETYGQGPPLLLIHGNGDSIAAMAHQIPYFAKHYRVIAADSRGHGKSSLGTGKLTYVQMMEDYNSLLDELGVKNAFLIGWSDGGILTLLLAIHHPDKVGKAAVMGANLRPDADAVNDWVPGLLQPFSDFVDARIASHDTNENWALQRALLDLLQDQPHISDAELNTIKVPVLVMAGDKDIIRAEHTLEIFRNIPKAQMAILPGQTHWVPADDAGEFNAMVYRFFSTPFTRPTSEAILGKMLAVPED